LKEKRLDKLYRWICPYWNLSKCDFGFPGRPLTVPFPVCEGWKRDLFIKK